MFDLKYNKIKAVVLLDAFDKIPIIRDGKGDHVAVASFLNDIRMFRKFKGAYNFAYEKEEMIKLIDQWNNYIALRNAEDFVPFNRSLNSSLYDSLFN